MLKHPIALDPPPARTSRFSRLAPIAFLCLLLPVAVPLTIEAVDLCRAQWMEMMGLPSNARTPMMDWIGEQAADARQEAQFAILSRFQRVPWNPRIAIGAIVAVMLLAIRMMRA